MSLQCVICTLNLLDCNNNIIDEYIYRVPYQMELFKFINILDVIIKEIFITDDKYTIYILHNKIQFNNDITKLNKLVCINKKLTILQKLFHNNINKLSNFNLLVKQN